MLLVTSEPLALSFLDTTNFAWSYRIHLFLFLYLLTTHFPNPLNTNTTSLSSHNFVVSNLSLLPCVRILSIQYKTALISPMLRLIIYVYSQTRRTQRYRYILIAVFSWAPMQQHKSSCLFLYFLDRAVIKIRALFFWRVLKL